MTDATNYHKLKLSVSKTLANLNATCEIIKRRAESAQSKADLDRLVALNSEITLTEQALAIAGELEESAHEQAIIEKELSKAKQVFKGMRADEIRSMESVDKLIIAKHDKVIDFYKSLTLSLLETLKYSAGGLLLVLASDFKTDLVNIDLLRYGLAGITLFVGIAVAAVYSLWRESIKTRNKDFELIIGRKVKESEDYYTDYIKPQFEQTIALQDKIIAKSRHMLKLLQELATVRKKG